MTSLTISLWLIPAITLMYATLTYALDLADVQPTKTRSSYVKRLTVRQCSSMEQLENDNDYLESDEDYLDKIFVDII